jgi:predicted DCC family thiol-disulfide oxidoreductase YuxK
VAENPLAPDNLMLFDGFCRFCSTSVSIALAFDRAGVIRFAPIQSPYGQALARAHGLDPDDPTTFYFFDRGRPLGQSDGVLALAGRLRAPLRWSTVFRAAPKTWRDAIYDWIAANRYRIFGRRKVCRLPSAAEQARFVIDLPAT